MPILTTIQTLLWALQSNPELTEQKSAPKGLNPAETKLLSWLFQLLGEQKIRRVYLSVLSSAWTASDDLEAEYIAFANQIRK